MPKFNANHRDTNEICQKTLDVSYADWQKMGFSKGTLHWMKKMQERINRLLSIKTLESG